jgi:GNAT superfamily N-acetyltransferase
MPTVFSIRPWDWESDDIEALTRLLHRAYAGLLVQGLRFSATSQPPEVTRSRMWGSSPFVMETGGRIIGTVTLSYPIALEEGDPLYYAKPGVALLSQFGLEPEFQGKGLGAVFFRHCLEWCRAAGAGEIALDTSNQALHLISMYEHWGFRTVARHQWPEANYESVVMARSTQQAYMPTG